MINENAIVPYITFGKAMTSSGMDKELMEYIAANKHIAAMVTEHARSCIETVPVPIADLPDLDILFADNPKLIKRLDKYGIDEISDLLLIKASKLSSLTGISKGSIVYIQNKLGTLNHRFMSDTESVAKRVVELFDQVRRAPILTLHFDELQDWHILRDKYDTLKVRTIGGLLSKYNSTELREAVWLNGRSTTLVFDEVTLKRIEYRLGELNLSLK